MLTNTRKLKNKLTLLSSRWYMDRESTLRNGKIVIQHGIKQKNKELKHALFKVYVDDEFVVATGIGPGRGYDKV